MPSSECKDAERRIGKDIGRFGIVKRATTRKRYINISLRFIKRRIRSVKQSVEAAAKRLM